MDKYYGERLEAIKEAKIEIQRLYTAINKLEEEVQEHGSSYSGFYTVYSSKKAAMHRACIDTKKALTDLVKAFYHV